MKKNIRRKRPIKGKGPNAIWLLLLLGFVFGFLFWFNTISRERSLIKYSTFLEQVEKDNVKSVSVLDQQVQGEFKKPVSVTFDDQVKQMSNFETVVISTDELWDTLQKHKVSMQIFPQQKPNWGLYFLLFLLFIPLLGLVLLYFMRQGQGGGGASSKIFNVGKSRAKFFSPNTIKIKFKDVAGVEEAKDDLQDVVNFLKNPDQFKRLGAKIPQGILLTGAPGNGKTMLAKAVAGEASCPFFSISGSDFVEVFVGVGASRVRDLFLQARKHAPCIVFIDEIDAIGRHRGVGVGGGNEEREQTLNQLLSEMDGFSTTPGAVIVLAATNRPDVLDKALLRPGRFDRKVEVPYPDLVSREKILKIHATKVKLASDVDLKIIARGTPRFSGADLANLINEAALIASKKKKDNVDMGDFELARDKILVGAVRKTLTRTKEEIEMTAYHESGHTMVLVLSPHAQPLHKVTILSRGGTLGITWYLPEGDEVSRSEVEMLTEIMVCMGGRLAEELQYGIENRTTGALNDLKSATATAREMVCMYGMSELGPIAMTKQEGGMSNYSEATAQKIDEQVSKIIDSCYQKTKTLLVENKDKLDSLAKALVEKETLEAKEVYSVLGIEPKKMAKSFGEESGKTKDKEEVQEPVKDEQEETKEEGKKD